MSNAKRYSVVRARKRLGWSVCPQCKIPTPNDSMVEIIRPDKKRGKTVCFDCGLTWLKVRGEKIPAPLRPMAVGNQQELFPADSTTGEATQ